MAEKAKQSQRDSTLVNILERMADQLQKQDQLLDDVARRQFELSQALDASEQRLVAWHNEVALNVEKLQESFSRYRSDMMRLVNEQDHMAKDMSGLNKQANTITYAFETSIQKLAGLENRAAAQEKTASNHFTHALKQAEILPKEINASTRSITKLHMDTEKSLGRMHTETQRQLEKLQQDTTKRLMVLSDMDASLQTLLIRTEPPEKRPGVLTRLFRRVKGACRAVIIKIRGMLN